MKTTTNKQRKMKLVDQIVANPVYMPDSGVVQVLRKSLLRLPLQALVNLQLVIEFKEPDAPRGAR